ncbi:UDP-glycosyltransferase 86A1 [Hibiscus syriacus]|uniref:Glycosyltransferase n=1 Tax=Hibiscus syriacus TaxID=106335 RepID=A0A6A3CQ66_HIBSY|nr:UDP-glycosyltransferase 86A1 [Hibiscus syriacus]
MNNDHQKPHAIVIPYPLQGHVIPSVHLALKLETKGFVITFVNTQSIHQQITKSQPNHSDTFGDDIFTDSRKSGLDIRYVVVNDGFPLGFDRSLNHDQYFEGVLHVMSAHADELVGETIKTNPPPTCLIADTFFVWSSMISNKYNLVNVSFWTEPALVFTLYYHVDLLRKNGHVGSLDTYFIYNREDTIDYIPGIGAIEPKDLMSYLQASDTTTVVHRIIFKAFKDVKNADFIICNTIQELEPQTISALHEKHPTYAIGPIFPTGFTKSVVATSLWSESDCTRWLDTKPPGSVLYVSLGSYAHVSKNTIVEIAQRLLLSGVSFIWVLRPGSINSDETDVLLVGFEEEVKETGLMVPWCCQIEVISHPTVGGFLTHCGWNSILESVWCTVPLICLPLLTDQFTNRKLVVDNWKIGVNVCDNKQIKAEEVAETIHCLMNGKLGDELRKNIEVVKNKLENALSTDGSSQVSLEKFISDVKIKTQEKCASAMCQQLNSSANHG